MDLATDASLIEIDDLGHAFWVIDPTATDEARAFAARLERLLDQLTSAETIPHAPGRVLVHDEPETAAERRSVERGVVIDGRHHASLVALGEREGVPFPAGSSAG